MDLDTLMNILVHTKTPELVNLCLANSTINNICNSDYFWQLKVDKDFNYGNKPDNISWKQYYMWLYQSKEVPVTVFKMTRGTIRLFKETIGTIIIKRTDTLLDVVSKAVMFINQDNYQSPIESLRILDENNRHVRTIHNPLETPDGPKIYSIPYINLDRPLMKVFDDIHTLEFN